MKIIKCDRCKKEIEKWYLVQLQGCTGNGMAFQGKREDWELCEECMFEFNQWKEKKTA